MGFGYVPQRPSRNAEPIFAGQLLLDSQVIPLLQSCTELLKSLTRALQGAQLRTDNTGGVSPTVAGATSTAVARKPGVGHVVPGESIFRYFTPNGEQEFRKILRQLDVASKQPLEMRYQRGEVRDYFYDPLSFKFYARDSGGAVVHA